MGKGCFDQRKSYWRLEIVGIKLFGMGLIIRHDSCQESQWSYFPFFFLFSTQESTASSQESKRVGAPAILVLRALAIVVLIRYIAIFSTINTQNIPCNNGAKAIFFGSTATIAKLFLVVHCS